MLLGGKEGFVGSLIQKGVDLSSVGDLDLHDPGIEGLIVDQVRRRGKLLVDANNLTRDGRVQVRGSLDGLDSTERSAGLDGLTDSREIDKDNLSQRISGVLGNTNLSDAILDLHPLVSSRELLYAPSNSAIATAKTHVSRKLDLKEL